MKQLTGIELIAKERRRQIEKELRQAKNDYKHLASGDLHSCIN
jgi:hypothetical protein